MIHSDEEKERIVSEYIAGAEIPELCDKYNIAYGTIQAWLIKRNCIRNYKPYRIKTGNRIKQDYILHEDYAEIKIRRKNGFSYAKIDIEDVQRCRDYGIWAVGGNGYISARSRETGNIVYLHRFILGIYDKNVFVDHINHDILDCRKVNLRPATPSQNLMNYKLRKDNSYGVRGVYYDKSRDKWTGRLTVNGESFGKRFDTFEEAVEYRKELEDKYFGEYKFNEESCPGLVINGMEHFQEVCRNALVEWYNKHEDIKISYEDTFVVWSCKTLQNYKALLSTTVSGDGIYCEYTYNGDKKELYEDAYKKLTNRCIKE